MSNKYGVFSILLVLSCSLFVRESSSVGLQDALDIIQIAKDVVVAIAKAWNIVDQHVDFSDIPIPILDKTETKLFGKIGIITAKLDRISGQVDAVGTNTIASVLQTLPDRIRLELRLNTLLDYITRMDVLYRNFQNYAKNKNDFERLTLEDFAKSVVSHDSSSVNSLVERIHAFIAPTGRGIIDGGLMKALVGSLEEIEGDMICNSKQSPQQVLYNLYNTIALTELKGYTMIQFSYMLLRLYNQGNFTTEAQIVRDRYEERTNNAIEIVKSAMNNVSRELWNCDPKKHIKGETYEEITQLLQGYVQNEVDLNPEGTCRENCQEYAYTKSHGCFNNLYCRQQRRCNGKIINCQYFDSDMWICPADPSSGRRYEYIEYENGRVLGRKKGCSRGTTKVDSWWRWLFWHCSYCFCLCDEQGSNSDRYMNMRAVIADIENNRVVTGLRFVKNNRIIHLQIQEGKLLPRGNIDINTVHWVPIKEFKITDRKVYNGQDYHTFTWEKRAVDLDDLEADEGYVLTGVRFKEIGSHLNFEIYVSKFDFDTGKLINPQSTSVWKDNTNTDSASKNPRTRVRLLSPDIPIRSPSPSIPTSKPDQYIELTHTDLDRDAAQTTVPFLDAQKLESMQPVPLSGAGIFHKGRNFFGGFITPKIITYDFGKHLSAAFPDEEVNFTKAGRVKLTNEANDLELKNMKWCSSVTLYFLLAVVAKVKCHENLLVDQLRMEFLTLEDKLWDYVLDHNKYDSSDPGLHIIKEFHSFDSRIQKMPQDLLYGMDVSRQAKQFLVLFSDLRIISDMYDKFRRYQSTNLVSERRDYTEYKREITTSDIVEDILYDSKNNVNKTVRNIFEQIFGGRNEGNLFWEMFEIVSSTDYNCKNPYQPTQQVFYNMYNTIALADLKGYIMTQFAYMAQRFQRKGNYTELSLVARKQYESRLNATASSLRGAMEVTDTKLWRCDPKNHIQGSTYDQLTRLLQAHIQNEVDLNNVGTCTQTCDTYSFTKGSRCYDEESEYCRKRKPCIGNLINCRFIESHMTACISPASSLRRYEYIEFDSGRTMGGKTRCYNRKVNSWTRWFVHCSTCLCLCDEQGSQSDRYFNLRPVNADVENNRVVTGLRITKHNRIIHLQIQEGKLLPYGYIDNSTVRWVPVSDYKITDVGIKNKLDYHTMDYEKRTLFLDDLVPSNDHHIVTGVKFDYKNGNLRFQIRVSPFNFTTGVVSLNSYYVSSSGNRYSIDLDDAAIPTESPSSEPNWSPNRYIDFTHTSFEKDAAQTTVPFFDIQPVTSFPQVPLKGAGLYYKGNPGYGGFVAPKITTYDFTQHMIVNFPEAKNRVDTDKEFEVMPN
ncbi:uncharacterized protein [Leptinotarsa decemlineata]|uniref:uncharacterized protein n=1 Tax=Leptinotarsa decemlineata TaxID=7539 RepID=UPI003D305EB7